MSSDLKDRRSVRGDATKELILEAARESLREQGYSATSIRAVAERAGVQLSLVHYHFGSKLAMLVAVLEHENAKLLERQQALFAGPELLSAKWRAACRFLEDDLESGYVRILWELWAAGLPTSGSARWRDARRWLAPADGRGLQEWSREMELELPISAAAVATLVANLFQGLEVEILAGVSEAEAPHLEVLEAVAQLIEGVEARASR
jgi:AcrR family transcriptional regulator